MRKMPIASESWLPLRNRTTQPHWYNAVRTIERIVSSGHLRRDATHARPTLSSRR
jgi:hypothetical protein